jgi:hypothetical protein
MACGEEVEVEERYWTWCRKWGVPYRCRKTRTTTKYRYDFRPTRTRVAPPFRCRWEGCCGNRLYKWSHWCRWGTGNSAWDQFHTVTRYFKSPLNSSGDCPFSP